MPWFIWIGGLLLLGLAILSSLWQHRRRRRQDAGAAERLARAKDECVLGPMCTAGIAIVVITTTTRRSLAVRAIQSAFDLAQCPFRLRVYVLEVADRPWPSSSSSSSSTMLDGPTKSFLDMYENLGDHAWGRPWTSQIRHWRVEPAQVGGNVLSAAAHVLHTLNPDNPWSTTTSATTATDTAAAAAAAGLLVREPFTVLLGDGVIVRVPQWEQYVLAHVRPGVVLTQVASPRDPRDSRDAAAVRSATAAATTSLVLATESSLVLDQDTHGLYARPAWVPTWDRVSSATSLPVVGARPLAPPAVGRVPLVSKEGGADGILAQARDEPLPEERKSPQDPVLRVWSKVAHRHLNREWWSPLRVQTLPVWSVSADLVVGETHVLRRLVLTRIFLRLARNLVQSAEFLAWLLCARFMETSADALRGLSSVRSTAFPATRNETNVFDDDDAHGVEDDDDWMRDDDRVSVRSRTSSRSRSSRAHRRPRRHRRSVTADATTSSAFTSSSAASAASAAAEVDPTTQRRVERRCAAHLPDVQSALQTPVVSVVRQQLPRVDSTCAGPLRALFGRHFADQVRAATRRAAAFACESRFRCVTWAGAMTLVPEVRDFGRGPVFVRAKTFLGVRARLGTSPEANTDEIVGKFGSVRAFEAVRDRLMGRTTKTLRIAAANVDDDDPGLDGADMDDPDLAWL